MPTNAPATLHFTCGKMAAGKTTLARRLAQEYGAVLVGWDIWLTHLYPVEIVGFDDFLRYSGRLREAMAPHLADLLRIGQSVMLDYPANTPTSRAWVRSIFESARAEHRLHYVERSDAQCLEQLACRNRSLPFDSVHMSEQAFHDITALFVPPDPQEGFTIERH